MEDGFLAREKTVFLVRESGKTLFDAEEREMKRKEKERMQIEVVQQ